MDKCDKDVLQTTKEIIVKFIETQRVSPSNFAEIFPSVYAVVKRTVTPDTKDDANDSHQR